MKSRGFTLIETIAAVVVLAIAVGTLLHVMGYAIQFTIRPDVMSTATHLAEGELERVTNLRYSQIANQGPTASPAPFSNYTYEIRVSAVPVALANDPAMAQYKQVEVIIAHPSMGGITLTTVVTNKYT